LQWFLPAVFGIPLELIIVAVAIILIAVFAVYRRGKRAPARKAPTAVAAPVKVEKAAAPPAEKLDEDLVRLKVEKTATESALKSLEDAVKEGAITKETFEKHKATYTERLRKIDTELSKRPKTDVTQLETEVERVRSSYLEKLKDLSKKAAVTRPVAVTAPKVAAAPPKIAAAPAAPPKVAAPKAPAPSVKLPEVPVTPKEEQFELTPPPARVTPSFPRAPEPSPQPAVSAAPSVAPGGQATIADLRREMMDELNRLKRLIGRAET
jgi:FtsZ-interacting cell division protein ZipA